MKKVRPKGHEEGQDASGKLFETLKERHGFVSDRQLSDHFGLHRSSVSRVRHGGPVTLAMKLAIIAKDKMPLEEIERLIKKPRFDPKVLAKQQEGA